MKKALGLDPNFFPKSLLHFTQNKLGSKQDMSISFGPTTKSSDTTNIIETQIASP